MKARIYLVDLANTGTRNSNVLADSGDLIVRAVCRVGLRALLRSPSRNFLITDYLLYTIPLAGITMFLKFLSCIESQK